MNTTTTTPAQTQTTNDQARKNKLKSKLKNLALNVKELIHYTGNNPATLPSNNPL
jgi:hypothetical protein